MDSDWPSRNTTSIRTRSSATRHQLREHAAGGMRMDEGDVAAHQPGTGLLVDQLGATGCEPLELAGDVRHLESNVMHAGTAAVEEPPDRRVGTPRGEQLDALAADPHQRRVDSLVLERLAQLELCAEQAAVGVDRLVQVGHCDAEVMDAAHGHSRRCYRWGRAVPAG